MNIKQISSRIVLVFVAFVSLTTVFQNCGGKTELSFVDYARQADLASIQYPYSAKQNIFFEANLQISTYEKNFRDLILIATAVPANNEPVSIPYEVHFLNDQDQEVCIPYRGSFDSSRHLIEELQTCPSSQKIFKMIYKINYQGEWHEQVQTFSSPGI